MRSCRVRDTYTRYLQRGTKACSCTAVFLSQKKPGNTHIHLWTFFQNRRFQENMEVQKTFKKNTLKENKWTFNDKQILWASLYIYTIQFCAGLTTKGLSSLQSATVCHPAKATVGAQLCNCLHHPCGKGGHPLSPLSHPAVRGCMICNSERESSC